MAVISSAAPALDADHRILPDEPVRDLADYERLGGGAGLRAAMAVDPAVVLGELEASGLRGRGGAGFPTGAKWRTIMAFASDVLATAVVVNAAEGEPGTYKDRLLLERNPYAVLEGAMIAAHVAGTRTITIATKAGFAQVDRLRAAIDEIAGADWNPGFEFAVVEGPREYLYGEETALLEVIAGRPPFPRIAPPWRRGVVEVVDDSAEPDDAAVSGLPANLELGSDRDENLVPPVLVNNVETFANVPAIVARGAEWFRAVGTPDTPGTLLCTVTGAVARPGVYEVAAGTSLRVLLAMAGSPPDTAADGSAEAPMAAVAADPELVLLGVSNAALDRARLDTPLSHDAFRALGSGLGSASFLVVDAAADPVAVAAGASRFLAVESCGQCTPCKHDGLEIATILDELCASEPAGDALERLDARLATVADGARCSLALQHQTVVGSIRRAFPSRFDARMEPSAEPLERVLIAELTALDGARQEIDTSFDKKQPDWTYDATDSGQTPVDRLADHRAD
jgi:NADH:ubiquinone oxidoreductase subunit F (NADH-binding)